MEELTEYQKGIIAWFKNPVMSLRDINRVLAREIIKKHLTEIEKWWGEEGKWIY